MKRGLLALVFIYSAASSAQAKVIQYLDDDGNVFEVPDRQSVPIQYRDRAIEVDKPLQLKPPPAAPAPGVQERLKDMLHVRQSELPPSNAEAESLGGAKSSADQAARPGGAASSGAAANGASGARSMPGQGAHGQASSSAAAKVDMNKLKEALAKQKDPLLRRLTIASTAALATGYLWVALLAIVLFGFILATRRLIPLEDSLRKRRFWRWGFPALAVAVVALLHKWRYPKYLAVLEELLRAFGV